MSFKDLKEEVWKQNLELPKHNLVVYTFGNVSAIERAKGVIAIKPSGVAYVDLTPDKIVIVDLENNVVEGTFNPSSDTKTHLELYKAFPKIGGIVHTHSTFATAWAQAQKAIPCFGTTHADHLPCAIPCSLPLTKEQIEGDYEIETGKQIVKIFTDISYEEVQMALVANHGPFTWGDTAEKAVYNSVILEELAKMAYLTLQLDHDVKTANQDLINKHFYRKHGINAYYGQRK